jgi:hypothetical protein
VYGIAFWTACASREKCVKGVVGDSQDTIGHKKADLPHWFAIEALLQAAGRKHCFIRIVHVNDPSMERQTQRGQEVDCADEVMVAVQDIVFPTPQFCA